MQTLDTAAALPFQGTTRRNYPANLDGGTPMAWSRRLLSEARLVIEGAETVVRDGFEGLDPSLRSALDDARLARTAGSHAPGFPDREGMEAMVSDAEERLSTLVSDLSPRGSGGDWRPRGTDGPPAPAPAYDLVPVDAGLARAFRRTCLALAAGRSAEAMAGFAASIAAAADLLGIPSGPAGERCAAVMSRAGIGDGRPSHVRTATLYGSGIPAGTLAYAFGGFEAALFRLVRDGAIGDGRQPPVIGAAAARTGIPGRASGPSAPRGMA